MNHGDMNHGGMDHGGMDHGGMKHGSGSSQCAPQMLWNSQIADTCVVFPAWHIHSPLQMMLSCLAITLISIAYARLLRYIKHTDRRTINEGYAPLPTENGYPTLGRMSLPNLGASREPSPVGTPTMYNPRFTAPPGRPDRRTRGIRAGLYTLTVAISFFLMLVAMTYNTYLFGAILVGSFVGHFLYEEIDYPTGQGKGLACH
ncbi:hypothetical protein NliqN6_5716 [Naganishia liquefaciens]|uniref:Copper transport protein n=1 Tax=Naganishia liquefaciens TaxID=104408 RepID=A0A8H3U030_9TREE|nr:hypothetical protein NliqN6_5716 [Naganishia liquefaciens]